MYTPSSLWLVVVSSIYPLLVRISIWSKESIFARSLVPVTNMDFVLSVFSLNQCVAGVLQQLRQSGAARSHHEGVP